MLRTGLPGCSCHPDMETCSKGEVPNPEYSQAVLRTAVAAFLPPLGSLSDLSFILAVPTSAQQSAIQIWPELPEQTLFTGDGKPLPARPQFGRILHHHAPPDSNYKKGIDTNMNLHMAFPTVARAIN